jgi:hypothetical protein
LSRLDRGELAASLRHLARDRCALAGYGARIPASRTRVAAARPDLERLASRLADPDPVDARGVALTHELLSDGTGPLFWNRSADSLKARLREALEALEPRA